VRSLIAGQNSEQPSVPDLLLPEVKHNFLKKWAEAAG